MNSSDSSHLGNSSQIQYLKKLDFGANILFGLSLNSNVFAHINGQVGIIDSQPRLDGIKDRNTSMRTVGGGVAVDYKL